MDTKDIIGSICSGVMTLIAVWVFLKGTDWSLPKATKFSLILEKYKYCLTPQEIEFAEKEIERDVKQSILRIIDSSRRELILFVRIKSELTMPWWRWGHLAHFIKNIDGHFVITYNGKYRRSRYLCILIAITYSVLGWFYTFSFIIQKMNSPYLGGVLTILFMTFSVLIWNVYPSKKVIKKYNSELEKIDARDFPHPQ